MTFSSSTTRMRGVSCTVCGSMEASATLSLFRMPHVSAVSTHRCCRRCDRALVHDHAWGLRRGGSPGQCTAHGRDRRRFWAMARAAQLLRAPASPGSRDDARGRTRASARSGARCWLRSRSRGCWSAHTSWARELHVTLRGSLLGLTPGRMLQLSVLSALSEELLFRALLGPLIGLVPSALVFGVLHVSPRGTSLAWPLWAFVMGLLFGAAVRGQRHAARPDPGPRAHQLREHAVHLQL